MLYLLENALDNGYQDPVSGSRIPQTKDTENPQNYTGNVNVSQPSLTHFNGLN